jgi:hypothetical protein
VVVSLWASAVLFVAMNARAKTINEKTTFFIVYLLSSMNAFAGS